MGVRNVGSWDRETMGRSGGQMLEMLEVAVIDLLCGRKIVNTCEWCKRSLKSTERIFTVDPEEERIHRNCSRD